MKAIIIIIIIKKKQHKQHTDQNVPKKVYSEQTNCKIETTFWRFAFYFDRLKKN